MIPAAEVVQTRRAAGGKELMPLDHPNSCATVRPTPEDQIREAVPEPGKPVTDFAGGLPRAEQGGATVREGEACSSAAQVRWACVNHRVRDASK